jgi:vanillate O-demethylase ferredoxin subunit
MAGVDLRSLIGEPQRGLHVYVCGPAGMIDAALALSRERGWPESHLHFELFSNPLAEQAVGDKAVEVVLARSGITLEVQPGTSILDAILNAGIEADYDCQVGECGTCLTQVLEGAPLHRDYYLNEKERAEGRTMCTCVSWAKSDRLVLDI